MWSYRDFSGHNFDSARPLRVGDRVLVSSGGNSFGDGPIEQIRGYDLSDGVMSWSLESLGSDTSEFTVTGFWFERLCGTALLKAELDSHHEAARHCHDEVNFYSWAELESRDNVRYENLGDFCYGEVTSTFTCQTADLSP